jgi:hypothetical protein
VWTQSSNHSEYDEREQCGHGGAVTTNMTSASSVDTGVITPNDEREQCGHRSNHSE